MVDPEDASAKPLTDTLSKATQTYPPNQTLYLRNLPEKVRLPVLKELLYHLCLETGVVIDVSARAGVRMRGQAFVVMADIPAAARTLRAIDGLMFMGQPIRAAFAKEVSRIVADAEGGGNGEVGVKRSIEVANRHVNDTRDKKRIKQAPEEDDDEDGDNEAVEPEDNEQDHMN
ncbi:hypothetical protein PYCC9005_003659 [Savitreella phatthalungensis]